MFSLSITTSSDPFAVGLDYLYGLRAIALDPEMIDLVYDLEQRGPICTWIGTHIQAVNARLYQLLQDCHDCFHPSERRPIQIFAAPLASAFGIDALCNLHTDPISILIDVGRVVPADWSRLVLHEYAHAHAGSPGHHDQFAHALAHLCLGLGIAIPLRPYCQEVLRSFPGCTPTQDPLAFWRGRGESWQESGF